MSDRRPRPAHEAPRIRPATVDDLPALRRLFNALIPTTTVAWRDEAATPAEMAAWFTEQQDAHHPVFVAELDRDVVGYTCWTRFRGGPRFPGYRHTVEDTIHVDGAHHRRGIGRALLAALLAEAPRRDVHVIVAGLDSANLASIELHRSMGFTEVGRMPELGRKFDRWLDLVLMQRILE
jgi:phosphinothricin acetyltransferase